MGIYIASTLFFPALSKIRFRKRLAAYYSIILSIGEGSVRFLILIVSLSEILLAVLVILVPGNLIVGLVLVGTFLAFLVFRIFVIRFNQGRVSCGCSGAITRISNSEYFGGVFGVFVLVGITSFWTFA